MISSTLPMTANTGARAANNAPCVRSRQALHQEQASTTATKPGIATYCGLMFNQRETVSGITEIQTIIGGLISTRSTYNSRPAIQRRATYSSQAMSSFSGERSAANRTTASTVSSASMLSTLMEGRNARV